MEKRRFDGPSVKEIEVSIDYPYDQTVSAPGTHLPDHALDVIARMGYEQLGRSSIKELAEKPGVGYSFDEKECPVEDCTLHGHLVAYVVGSQ